MTERTPASASAPDADRLALFFGILVALAALLLLGARFLGVSPVALAPAYMFSPLLAGAAVCVRHNVPVSAVGFRIGRPRWLAASALAALPLVGLTLLLAVAVPGVGFDPAADPIPGVGLPSGLPGVLATLALALGLGVTVNAAFALGEEFGWRGYLLWELAPLGFWRASTVIGVAWGVWHAPVIVAGYNYPAFPVVGVVAMTVATLVFTPLYVTLVARAESVLAAALLHGVFNGSAGLVFAYATADDPLLRQLVASPVGAAGVAAFALAAAGIALAGAPSLSEAFEGEARPRIGGTPAED